MFGRFAIRITNFLLKWKWLTLIGLGLVIFLLSRGVKQLHVQQDIYSVFPKGEEVKKFQQTLQENKINKQIVFSIAASEGVDENYEQLEQLKASLEKNFERQLSTVKIYQDVDESTLLNYLQDISVLTASDGDYVNWEASLGQDSIAQKIDEAKEKLSGSATLFLADYFANDPLQLHGADLVRQKDLGGKKYIVEDGLIYSKNKKKVFFFANHNIASENTKTLIAFKQKLDDFVKRTNQEFHYKVAYFGTFLIAVENAVQVQEDTSTIAWIGVVLIVLLLFFYYRNIFVTIFFLLPTFFGVLCGLGMFGYLQQEVSAIALATSAVLLGIILDYSFHFFTEYKHTGNVLETVRSVSFPMLLGSFTTVAAFFALTFTDSVVLQNFGWIALFSLIGAALFTVFVLPVILRIFNWRMPVSQRKSASKKRTVFTKIIGTTIILGTVFFLWNGIGIQFNDNLNDLSFHPKELQKKEEQFTGVQPQHQKKFYVFVEEVSMEKAKLQNFNLYKLLHAKKDSLHVQEVSSAAPYYMPTSLVAKQGEKWETFWCKNKVAIRHLDSISKKEGFSEQAFQAFKKRTNHFQFSTERGEELAEQLQLDKLYSQKNESHTFLTSVIVDKSKLVACKKAIAKIDGVYILDVGNLAENMLETVSADFNFLILFSSLLVFVSLLVVYGRIELALLSFLPMVVAWIWILGVAKLIGLEFNFVNIIVATFIFGLGDDFSIFITDGLMEKYRTKSQKISGFKSAIFLSGITTIIGTGVLIFAKHPAIHSIAIVSVVGVATILLISLYLQPAIFNFIALRRQEKGRGPLTFFIFIYSCLLFLYFFLGSLLINLFLLLILLPLPIKTKKKRSVLNFLVAKLSKSTLYAGFQIKKEVLHKDRINNESPCIMIANHSSFLDILAVLTVNDKNILMVKKWVYNSPVFGLFIRYCGYIFAEEGAAANTNLVKERLDEGYSLVIFPEGTRSKDGEIKRFHKGAFFLSMELNVPIQPMIISGIHEVNPKNDVMIYPGRITMAIQKCVFAKEGETYSQFSKRILADMREKYANQRNEKLNSKELRSSVLRNYLLKGPVLEWYVRVKYWLERKNFEYYDAQIAGRTKIYDIGCGYGYLSYYLHYRNPKRKIIGIDYDEEKIKTAQNGNAKNNKLKFDAEDIRKMKFRNGDAFFFNDVLHYLEKKEQFEVLKNAVDALEDNGIVFIRDGIFENKEKFKNTKRTEKLSTKLFRFNKTTAPLTFLSKNDFFEFAKKNDLSCELQEHSSTTSNVLFILRKNV